MEKETSNKADDFLKKMNRKTLENETTLLFHKTNKGRFVEAITILSGIGGIFLYSALGLNIIFSIILGFVTYLIVGAIFDKIIGKLFRIDKQIDWLENTSDGNKFLEEKGYNKEDMTDFKKDLDL